MAVDRPVPPDSVRKEVARSLGELAPVVGAAPPDAEYATRLTFNPGAWPYTFNVRAETPVFYLSLAELAEGAGLEAAALGGWRFVVESHGRLVGTLEVDVDEEGGAAQGAAFAESPADAVALSSIISARALDEETQPRLLTVPPLYVVALWLHRHGEDDLVVPLAGVEGPPLGEPTPAETFVESLRERARAWLELPAPEQDSAP